MSSLSGKKVAVVGMGRSGVAAARLLSAQGARVAITDDRTERDLEETMRKLEGLEVDYHLGGIDSELLFLADLIVISPGVPSKLSPIELARKGGVEVISEIELAAAFCDSTVVAVTGTNGKTTTTALIHRMAESAGLRAALAGNNETPFSQLAGEEPYDVVSLEVSSFQLENTSDFNPTVGAVLNVSPDHLDRYKGMDDYIAAKKLLFKNHSRDDFAVLNKDDTAVEAMAQDIESEVLWFSTKEDVQKGAFLRGTTLVARFKDRETEIIKTESIPLMGWHNIENVLAAIAATLPIELPLECYGLAVADFPIPEHRLEKVRELEGVLYVNDSKATNIGALEKSLESFSMPIVLIAGGRGKKSSYRELRPLVEAKVKTLITIGEDASALEEAFADLVSTERVDTMQEAVEVAAVAAEPGDLVLLAPACASFDMFNSYGHRGNVFKEAVNAL